MFVDKVINLESSEEIKEKCYKIFLVRLRFNEITNPWKIKRTNLSSESNKNHLASRSIYSVTSERVSYRFTYFFSKVLTATDREFRGRKIIQIATANAATIITAAVDDLHIRWYIIAAGCLFQLVSDFLGSISYTKHTYTSRCMAKHVYKFCRYTCTCPCDPQRVLPGCRMIKRSGDRSSGDQNPYTLITQGMVKAGSPP